MIINLSEVKKFGIKFLVSVFKEVKVKGVIYK